MRYGLLLLSAFLLLACNPPVSKRHVLVLGDSNGVGQGWVYAFQDLRGGGPLVNTAIGGNTIGFNGQNTLRRNTSEQITAYLRKGYAEMGRIDEILIALGTNDCKAEYADRRGEVIPNLETLLERTATFFEARGQEVPRIVLMTPPAAGDDGAVDEEFRGVRACLRDLSAQVRDLATREGYCLVDWQETPGPAVLGHSPDGIHFRAPGYRMLAEAVLAGCY